MVFLFSNQASALLISKTSSNTFYTDDNYNLVSAYASFAIVNNDPQDYPDLWVSLGGFSSANLGLAPYESGLFHLGFLGSGESSTVFFYLSATVTASAQSATVTVYPSKPPAGSLASQGVSWVDVQDTGQNNSNQVNTVLSGPNPPALGGIVQMAVSGSTGTIGSQNFLAFSPATYVDWPANSFQLYATQLVLYAPNAATINNQLFINFLTSTASSDYVMTYYFRAVSASTQPSTVSPVGFFAQGANVGHTATGAYAGANFLPSTSLSNYLVMSKTADASLVVWPNPVTYSITFSNSGILDASLEQVIDSLPSSPGLPGYVAGSSTWDGAPLSDPVQNGSTLTWGGFFTVPAGGSMVLSYATVLAPLAGTYVNQAVALVGSTQIDRSVDAGDNSPAACSVAQLMPTATPTFTNSPTRTNSMSPSHTPTATPSFTITPTFSDSPTFTPSPTISETHTISPTFSVSPTISASSTLSPSFTRSPTPSASPSASPTATPSATATASPSRTASRTRTSTRTASATRSITPTLAGTFTATPTKSPTPSRTPTPSQTMTSTRTWSFTPTASPTATVSPSFSASPSFSFSPTESPSFTISPTATPTRSFTSTRTETPTSTASSSPSPTGSGTATPSATPTPSATRTITPTFSDSPTRTVSPTITATFSFSPTASHTPTITQTLTPVKDPVLQRPWPNPLRPLKGESMKLSYQISIPGTARLKIYNLAGELVRSLVEADLGNGSYLAVWDGRNQKGDLVSSGTYVVLFETNGVFRRSLVAVVK